MKPESDPSCIEETRVVFGLGNPGPMYAGTPHNAGFLVLDELMMRGGASWGSSGRQFQMATIRQGAWDLCLVRPLTYVNLSSRALEELRAVLEFRWEHFCVVTDDWDLAQGHLRLRPSGGAGTHNGMRSLLELRPEGDFPRVRVGIRPPYVVECLRDYVIAPLPAEEMDVLRCAVAKAADAVTAWLAGASWQSLMSRYNGPVVDIPPIRECKPLAPMNGG